MSAIVNVVWLRAAPDQTVGVGLQNTNNNNNTCAIQKNRQTPVTMCAYVTLVLRMISDSVGNPKHVERPVRHSMQRRAGGGTVDAVIYFVWKSASVGK